MHSIENLFKVNAYPWIAALLRDEDNYEDDYINSHCSSVLVSTYLLFVGSYWIKDGL